MVAKNVSNGVSRYVPILKAKKAEFWSLLNLTPTARSTITPLLEITPIPKVRIKKGPVEDQKKPKKEKPPKTFAEHATDKCKKISTAWGTVREFFLDVRWLDENATSLLQVFKASRSAGLKAVPVAYLGYSDQMLRAIAHIAKTDDRGCMLRVSPKQLKSKIEIDQVIKSIGVTIGKVHLLLDYRSAAMNLETDLSQVPNIGAWKSFTTAAGAFPPSLSTCPENKWHTIARTDWTGWKESRKSGLVRIPDFGDYTVKDPGAPAGGGDPPVVLRYTGEMQWTILKHGRLTKGGAKKMPALCAALASHENFKGKNYSAGDLAISNTANRITDQTGGACEWLQWAMSHHLEFVVQQLLSLNGT